MGTAGRIALCCFFTATMVAGVWFHWSASPSRYQPLDTSKGAGTLADLGSAIATHGLKFSTLEHDFGSLRSSASFTFDFENQSGRMVQIKSITPSCLCTLTKPDKTVFNPGEKGRITVTVDPTRQRPGRHAYSIVVEYEGDLLQPTRLLLYAENKPDIEIPEQIVIRSVGDRSGKSPFTIIDYRENVLEIKEIQTSSPQLLVRVIEKPTIYLPGWKYVFEASFNGANLVPGDSAESIRFRTTDPEHPILTIPVVIHKIRRIRVAPETLYLRATKSDKRTLSGTIYIDDREDSLVEIASVQASREDIQCTYTRRPLARHQIEVCFNGATKQEFKFPQEVRITTKSPVREDIVVKIYCKPSSTSDP